MQFVFFLILAFTSCSLVYLVFLTIDVAFFICFALSSWGFVCFLYLHGQVFPYFGEVFFYNFAKNLVYTLDAIVILIHISSMYIPSGLLNKFFRAVPTQVLGPF